MRPFVHAQGQSEVIRLAQSYPGEGDYDLGTCHGSAFYQRTVAHTFIFGIKRRADDGAALMTLARNIQADPRAVF